MRPTRVARNAVKAVVDAYDGSVCLYAWDAQDPVLEITNTDGAVETVRARHYLVATGSTPWAPPVDGLEEVDYLTSTTAMELPEVPESLIVLGGGYVALEQAQLFARLGSRVTVLVRSRLLSKEEPEVSKTLMGVFADEGIQVVRRAAVESVATRIMLGDKEISAAQLAERLGFAPARQRTPVGDLSGGQRRRLQLLTPPRRLRLPRLPLPRRPLPCGSWKFTSARSTMTGVKFTPFS